MHLEGTCHCKKISFGLVSHTPYPYRYCYCTRCRKTNGGIGGAVNIAGSPSTFEIVGEENVVVYFTRSNPPAPGAPPVELQLHNCKHCGSHLYVISPQWKDWIYPAAAAIDTPLPTPPEYFHINLSQKPKWVYLPEGTGHVHFDAVPEESIEGWHKRHGLWQP